ncbi:MAG: hypothetical protein KA154_18995 [Gemmatimonadaceae bacterium]|nr:hypothetical protein [Gemmatimonadaceae bacterium]
MARESAIQTQFNGGELSPLMEGRVDLPFYQSGCRSMMNMIPTVQGPAKRRPGTRFIFAPDKEDDNIGFAVPFVASVSAVYIVVFGDAIITVLEDTSTATTESVSQVDFVTPTPYGYADFYRSDGSIAFSFVQSGDVLYIAHPDYPTHKLMRDGSVFTLVEAEFTGGPWKEANDDDTITVYASAATGSVTLQASADIFTANHVGSLFRIEQADLSDIKPWEPGQKSNGSMLAVNSLRRSDGRTYKATTVSNGTAPSGGTTAKFVQTGSVKPTHTKGKAWDGDQTTTLLAGSATDYYTTGVEWEYQDPGFGIFRITAFTDANTVTATAIERAPDSIVGSGNASWRWEFGAWSEEEGYPEVVTFFRERLTFARGIKVWGSTAGDFENFHDREFGEVLPDSAFTIDIIKDQANAVTWMSADDGLLVGTTGGEFAVGPATASEPFGPANVKVTRQSDYGSTAVAPIKVGPATLFVQRGGRKLRELAFSFDNDQYIANDLTIRAEHITKGGIVSMAWCAEPDSIIWCVTGAGELIGFTYNREQDVLAWHRHDVGGLARQVFSYPCQAQGRDILVVTVDRGFACFSEALSLGYVRGEPLSSAMFLDCAVTTVPETIGSEFYANVNAGLGGQTLSIMLDGSTHPDRTVVNPPGPGAAAVLLDRNGTVAHVGYHNEAYVETMRFEAGAADGTAQGKIKRLPEVTVRFIDTVGALAGPDADNLDRVEFRTGSTLMGSTPALFTGDKRITWPSGFETEGRVYVSQNEPLPITIAAIMPQVLTQDKG